MPLHITNNIFQRVFAAADNHVYMIRHNNPGIYFQTFLLTAMLSAFQ
jgi:hypothetical protein